MCHDSCAKEILLENTIYFIYAQDVRFVSDCFQVEKKVRKAAERRQSVLVELQANFRGIVSLINYCRHMGNSRKSTLITSVTQIHQRLG